MKKDSISYNNGYTAGFNGAPYSNKHEYQTGSWWLWHDGYKAGQKEAKLENQTIVGMELAAQATIDKALSDGQFKSVSVNFERKIITYVCKDDSLLIQNCN